MTRRVLVLSHPRSGSSWLGASLANSPLVDYRREPVLQQRLGTVPDAFGSSSGLLKSQEEDLRRTIEEAFDRPAAPVVVVKEVTPLLLADFLDTVEPEVLMLVRHPIEVAASHLTLGWLPGERLLNRAGIGELQRSRLREVWASSGLVRMIAYLAASLSSIDEVLEEIGAVRVRYEELKAGSLGNAGDLFTGVGLTAGCLASHPSSEDRADEYGVGMRRAVTPTMYLPEDELATAMAVWTSFDPAEYTDPGDWLRFAHRSAM